MHNNDNAMFSLCAFSGMAGMLTLTIKSMKRCLEVVGMIVVKSKKSVLSLVFIAFLGVMFGVSLRFLPVRNTFFSRTEKRVIVVDAGHGLPDGGAVGVNGTVEQEINLKVSLKVAEVLKSKDFDVVLTREGEESLAFDEDSTIRHMKVEDMKKRRDIINESDADLFLSVHMNSFPDESAHGLRFFYAGNQPEIAELAEKMQDNVSRVSGAKPYAVKKVSENLYLMKDINVPAILAECGFLSNPEEEKKLNDDEYISKLAWALADAIGEYYK